MSEITNHKKDALAVDKQDNNNGKPTTRGWKLLVEWKDGSSNWVPLVELKESNPIEVAEYAVANIIDDQPAFKWWVPKVLRERNWI